MGWAYTRVGISHSYSASVGNPPGDPRVSVFGAAVSNYLLAIGGISVVTQSRLFEIYQIEDLPLVPSV